MPSTEHDNSATSSPAGQDERGRTPRERNNDANQRHTTSAPPEAPRLHHSRPTRATITLATLNINGFASSSHKMTGINKWSMILRTMSTRKIVILALQKTHLDQDLLNQVNECYGRRLIILLSQDPDSPCTSAGVAFVINKRLINPDNIKVFELIKGRALAIKLQWHDGAETTLLNIYAPNSRTAQPDFWNMVDS